jgi:hypothetical protein
MQNPPKKKHRLYLVHPSETALPDPGDVLAESVSTKYVQSQFNLDALLAEEDEQCAQS